MTTLVCTIPTRPGIGQRLQQLLAVVRSNVRRRREAARMRRSLSALSDAALRDLAFHRCEIDALVAETQMAAEHRRRRVGRL